MGISRLYVRVGLHVSHKQQLHEPLLDHFLVHRATRMDFLPELLVHDTTSNLVVPVYLRCQDPSPQRHSYLLVIRPIIQLVDGKANTRVIVVFLHLDDLLHAPQLLRVGQRTGERSVPH